MARSQTQTTIRRYKRRYWAVYDTTGELVVVTLYKRGAQEVSRRLSLLHAPTKAQERQARHAH